MSEVNEGEQRPKREQWRGTRKAWSALISWLKTHMPRIWWDKRTRTIVVDGGKMRR